jgi:peptide/nickel transport system permease protein
VAAFLARRALRLVAVLAAIVLVSFLFMRAIPGDPATIRLGEHATAAEVAALTKSLGLDRPWYVQLVDYGEHLLRGDLGTSVLDGEPVAAKLGAYFPATAELAAGAMLFAALAGVPLGILAALRHRGAGDVLISSLAIVGVSLPVYWLGWMLVYALGVLPSDFGLNLFPISGRGDPGSLLDQLHHLALPALTLGTIPLAIIVKVTRTSMLDVLGSDYVRTARAKGAAETTIVLHHALRNALIPIVTILGLQTGILLGGAVLTEHIFAWPGIGRLTFDAISNRDVPVVNGCLMLFAAVFVVAGAAVDVLYAVLDPRIGSRNS